MCGSSKYMILNLVYRLRSRPDALVECHCRRFWLYPKFVGQDMSASFILLKCCGTLSAPGVDTHDTAMRRFAPRLEGEVSPRVRACSLKSTYMLMIRSELREHIKRI